MHRCNAASLVGHCWDQSTNGAKGNGFGGIPHNQCLQYHLSEVDHLKKGKVVHTYVCLCVCMLHTLDCFVVEKSSQSQQTGGNEEYTYACSNPVHIPMYMQCIPPSGNKLYSAYIMMVQIQTHKSIYLKLTDCPAPLPMWGHFSSTAYTRPLYRNTASSWPLIDTFFPRFGFRLGWPSVLAVPLWKSAS